MTGKAIDEARWSLAFNVIDSGIGFVHQERAELYQHFFQVDGSMTRNYGGLGIGLAICRRLVELMGGQLTHYSLPRQGSQFQVSLELEALAPATQSTLLNLKKSPIECAVLLVEDHDVGAPDLYGMLLALGYRVHCADSGQAAIDLLRRERVDAVLLGCPLARITATSKDAQLLTLAVCLQLPVLAVFESAAEAQAARGQVDAITDALSKPLGIDDVQHALAQRLLVVGEGKSAGS